MALLLALLVLGSRPVQANEANHNEEAVGLGHQGLSLYESGKWEEAFARFEQANELAHSPVFMLYMARCRRNAGRLLEAVQLFEALFEESPPGAPPAVWSNALRDGRAELNALRLRVPSLKVAGQGVATARLDGRVVKTDQAIEVNPGEHVVQGWSSDGKLSLRRIVLSEGQRDVLVTLSFEPEVRPAPANPAARAVLPVSREGEAPGPSRTAFWIAGGAAAGFAVLGTVTGLMAASQADSVRSQCDGNSCPEHLEDDADRARLLANVSTAAFGIAGVNLAFSIGYLLLSE